MSEQIVAGLDIGTTKIGCIIGQVDGERGLKIIGVGKSRSEGLRRGVVINIEKTVESIRKAVDEAERMAGVDVESVFAGIAGDHIRSINGRGVVAVSTPGGEIGHEDVRRVIDAAKAVALPIDREIIHVLPQEFIVDEQRHIPDPIGMSGVRLEAEVHIVTGAVASAQNIYRCIERAGLGVSDIVLEPLASSYSVLDKDERELGVAVIDVGGGTTDVAMFFENSIRHTGVVGLGGRHVTSDIALGLRTPLDQAERLKIQYGTAWSENGKLDETISVPGVGGRAPRKVSRNYMMEIIRPRMEEILRLTAQEMAKSEFRNLMTAGAVITGGASLLRGTVELAEEILEIPVKLGVPDGFSGLVDQARNPIHATGVGLVQYAIHRGEDLGGLLEEDEDGDDGVFLRIKGMMQGWVQGFRHIR